ncbi:hypothetical protein ACFL7E_08285 [Thermodesulfobacteriota bacterium]
MDIKKMSVYCDRVLDLKGARLGDMHYYQSLSFCVIEAVFSINVRYESTQNTVIKYCNYFNLKRIRKNRHSIPPIKAQEPIELFVKRFERHGIDMFTEKIFNNRQRTSTTSGILKSEAVYRFAQILKKYGVNYFQDVPEVIAKTDFENDIRSIPGQKSGISLNYFYMMSGADDLIKPDRHVLNFVNTGLGKRLNLHVAENVVYETYQTLKLKYPHLTARLLDNVIWNYQRALAKKLRTRKMK